MASMAWQTGDPGVVFIDRINADNPTPKLDRIESTNPCGEQPLLPYESCTLGSVNLTQIVKDDKIDWDKLAQTISIAVHFLDNVIDANRYPLKKIELMTKANRKIGIGIMGFAEMLIKLGIPYASEKALSIASNMMEFISKAAREKSNELGDIRGSFPNFQESVWNRRGVTSMRNATVTTVAPTGTISIIAGCSSGIEPLFALSFVRNVLEGTKLLEVNPLFEYEAKKEKFYDGNLMMEAAKNGSIQSIPGIPPRIKNIFQTAFDIAPEWHVKMQAAFQKHTDNAVSKTVNLPHEATIDDVRKVYLLANELKCKGVTIYRYGSKSSQVLYTGGMVETDASDPLPYMRANSEYAGGCPTSVCNS
jgi:ribonucleoside-diphosphate reductase alpha chain